MATDASMSEGPDGMSDLIKKMKQFDGASVLVGIQGDAKPRDGKGRLANAEIGAIHEFGAPSRGIPERSFLRSTLDGQRESIVGDMRDAFDRALRGDATVRQAIDGLGLQVEARVKETIRKGIKPGLNDATIKRRRAKLKGGKAANKVFTGETPLIDTGQLIQSITAKTEGL